MSMANLAGRLAPLALAVILSASLAGCANQVPNPAAGLTGEGGDANGPVTPGSGGPMARAAVA